MRDMNVKLGPDNTGRELIMGREVLGEMNENGELFNAFCAFNELVICGSVYKHRDIFTVVIRKNAKTQINTSEETSIERRWNNLKAGVESKLKGNSRQKEETGQTVGHYRHMETNRRDKDGETKDYPVHR
uniref:Uncharacterized protein n=1 Tax=Trichobilharzia regenti TaxID=157069 RepID=A0AA85JE85_TRIRE|nr:unnamed protein product [Trichobilharzia regenti]